MLLMSLAFSAIVVNQPQRGTIFAKISSPVSAARLPATLEAEVRGQRLSGVVKRESDGRIVLHWSVRTMARGCANPMESELELRSAQGVDLLSDGRPPSDSTLAPRDKWLPVPAGVLYGSCR
jgi:hypothetical protein